MVTYEECLKEFNKARTSIIFREKCKKIENHTYIFERDGMMAIKYHNTFIVKIDSDNNYYVCNGNWYTRSTLDRINRYIPIRFWQQKYGWFYVLKGVLHRFEGECTLMQEDLKEDEELTAFVEEAAVIHEENRYERDID